MSCWCCPVAEDRGLRAQGQVLSRQQGTKQGSATRGMAEGQTEETALMCLRLLPSFRGAERWLRVEKAIWKSSHFQWFMSQVES